MKAIVMFLEGSDPTEIIARGSLTDDCIHDVDVTADYRGQGIGTKIINALRSIGGEWLWVDTEKLDVVRFYEKCGFEMEDPDGERFAVMRIPPDPAEHEGCRMTTGNEPTEEDRRHIGDAITAARAYVAVSIKHSAYKWKFGMPLVLWGDHRTANNEARCFGGYTIFPSCAEHYVLGDFKKHGYPADIVKPEPVPMEIGFCKKWKQYDTVLVEADIYEAYCKICNLPLEPPS